MTHQPDSRTCHFKLHKHLSHQSETFSSQHPLHRRCMSAPQDDAPSGWLVVPSHESLYRLYPRNATTPGPPWEPTPPSNFGKDKMITLLVGTDEHELLVHEDYLARHSALFKAALKKEWAEGQTRTIKLPEETPDLVAFYLDFLYGKGLPTDFTRKKKKPQRQGLRRACGAVRPGRTPAG
jgi:hypothetical protein